MMTRPVLFLLAHPDLRSSRANKALARAGATVEGVETLDLYSEYPEMFIEGGAERRRLQPVSAIVIQMPLYWYGAPGLLKEWMDRTFISGWAYGEEAARQAAGKSLLLSITTGSDSGAWSPTGPHGAPALEYLRPFRQFAAFCGMQWCEPLVFHAARTASDEALAAHAARLVERLREFAGAAPDMPDRSEASAPQHAAIGAP